MRVRNIHGFKSIDAYVRYKIEKYRAVEKNFESLFELMFDESDNIMAETSDGYRITRITYAEYKKRILGTVPTLSEKLSDIPKGKMIGFYMSNSVDWIRIFWAILASGYSPLVMNTRLPDSVLQRVVCDHSVGAVISDSKSFCVKTLFTEELFVSSDEQYTPIEFGKEVVFMSSGTTDNVKLCAYNGENFYYQICDSASIIEKCPKIKKHYDGELKQLVLLPLCHVFGFIAVYLWFGFFSRTFVFPRDLNPQTIQRTVKKHRVTHVFAVPMVWEAVHKAAIKKIKERGDSAFSSFSRVSSLVNRLGRFGDFIAKRFLGEVREALFGDSICFLITGGSHIKGETLSFFNGIGYHLVNGYGMTEIGITSVEKSSKRRIANSASIGAPFGFTEYSISDDGKLLVRGKTRASRIMQGSKITEADYSQWFNTGDLMRCEGGRYFFDGRSDDLIVGDDGENLNPLIAERELAINDVDSLCLTKNKDGITLLVSVPGIFS
ncbi:MAG: AMP-binding protein, partial [Clostridia bacterium]|nr:AMP-binding protein [Clostridia bacterium]